MSGRHGGSAAGSGRGRRRSRSMRQARGRQAFPGQEAPGGRVIRLGELGRDTRPSARTARTAQFLAAKAKPTMRMASPSSWS